MIAVRGVSTTRWEKWRARNRVIVMQRCEGTCEAMNGPKRCTQPATDWHHLWGRGHIIAEPLASHHTMTVGLCGSAHKAAHRNERPLTPILKLAALQRVCAWFKLPQVDHPDQVRSVEAMLRAEGEWAKLLVDSGTLSPSPHTPQTGAP